MYFQGPDLSESEPIEHDNFELECDRRKDIVLETSHEQEHDMQCLTSSAENSSDEKKPDDNCLNLNCDFAKLHPEVTPSGIYKCNDCGIQLCNFCLYMTMKT